ncbi:MAG: AAA family ATPase, partial [Jaaginema sp. PMC 1079.18]|nr:AAA family ATPase [Jaaginema sp. PMC 1079.18]
MIYSLKLKNFKCFEDQSLALKNLTLLSGLNSSGKSSVLQSLLLLRQSYQQDLLTDIGLAINGDLVCLGTAQDILFEAATEDIIGFEITWENNIESKWYFKYDREVDVLKIDSSVKTKEIYEYNLF